MMTSPKRLNDKLLTQLILNSESSSIHISYESKAAILGYRSIAQQKKIMDFFSLWSDEIYITSSIVENAKFPFKITIARK